MPLPQVENRQSFSSETDTRSSTSFPVVHLPTKVVRHRGKSFSPLAAIIGAAIFGTGIFGYFSFQKWLENNFMNEIKFEIIPHSELNQIEKAINPNLGVQALKEAKACNVPLLFAVVKSAPGHSVQTFRIRSGDYLTPPIVVTEFPQRVPLPAPGPYSLGYGTIGLEGQFNGVQLWRVNQVWGEALNSVANKTLGVHWSAGPAC